MIRIPTHRTPIHPGEMLAEEFLKPMNIAPQELAAYIHVLPQQISELVKRRTSVTPATALRLARYFNTSPDFWMTLQLRWDLYHAQQAESEVLAAIQPRQSA